MPITPKYHWEQTDSTLTVQIELTGCSRSKTDVSATEAFIKVNAPPYLLQVDLAQDVDDARSRATLRPSGVTFVLFKKKPGLWPKLEACGDTAAISQRRTASITKAHDRIEAARLARLQLKEKAAKDATDRQIDLDRKKRQTVEAHKAAELAAERATLQQWQSRLGGDEGESEEDEPLEEAQMPDHPDYHGKGWQPATDAQLPANGCAARQMSPTDLKRDPKHPTMLSNPDSQHIWDKDTGAHDEDQRHTTSEAGSDKENDGLAAEPVSFCPLPPPRMRAEPVLVEFTSLETEHLPAREQREIDLHDYKQKLQDEKLLADSVSIADRQPLFLKDKGDQLYQAGSYQGAINAYTRAVGIDDSLTACFSNRAACHLKLGHFEDCVRDCTMALAQLQAADAGSEDPEAARRRLVRLLVRRGTAHGELKQLQEAAADYQQALKYDPANMQLAADLAEVQSCLRPRDGAALRKLGDACFRAQDLEGAVQAYTALLQLPDAARADRQAAIANRSAAYLQLGRYQDVVQDCQAAFQLLMRGATPKPGTDNAAVEPAVQHAQLDDTGGATLLRALGDEGTEEAAHSPAPVPAADCAHDIPSAQPRTQDTDDQLPEDMCGLVDRLLAQQASCTEQEQSTLLRILARRGAAYGHLKRYDLASRDLAAAALLHRHRGKHTRADTLAADSAKLRATQQEALQ